jgi:alkaline phosphatase
MGGGRRFYVPSGVVDEEGELVPEPMGATSAHSTSRPGIRTVWNTPGFNALAPANLPVLGLFERDHMEFEADRATDLGGEPSLTEMTVKSIQLLEQASRLGGQGYFLMVEGGRIDHAHHEGNAYRALIDTQEYDQAIGTAAQMVDLRETLIIVSADHSHVFNIAGYPLRPLDELPYRVRSHVPGFANTAEHGHGLLDLAYDINQTTGHVSEIATDRHAVRGARAFEWAGLSCDGVENRSADRSVPGPRRAIGERALGSGVPSGGRGPPRLETHAGEDVAIYAVGPGAEMVCGTVKNTHIFNVMKEALGL